jgi:rhodanese-related sulfurtransferase
VLARLMGLKTVSPKDLDRKLRGGEATAYDCNSPGSFARAHVPGAIRLDPAAFGTADLPPDKNAMLVFYCSNPFCRKAPNAARRARDLGWENVRVMSAGIQGWLNARLPVESGRES